MLVKNKTIIKLLISMVVIMLFVCATPCTTKVMASGDELLQDIEDDINNFKASAEQTNNGTINTDEITKNFIGIAQVLTMIGAGVMVAVTTYMGIKYLTAGPEAQGKLKVQLIGVLVSGLVIFGAYFIWKIVINIASTF